MKSIWKADMEAAGAEFDEQGITSFGNPEQEYAVALSGNVYTDLSHLSLVGVSGDDASQLMQGQFTNDIREVSEQQAQTSAWCNSKGRILHAFLAFKREDSYYLSLPAGQADEFIKRLRMFVLMSKVTLVDASGQWARLGCSGPDMETELERALATAPPAGDYQVVNANGLSVIRIPGLHPRYQVIGDADAMVKLREQLDVEATGIGRGPWQLLEIASGVAVIEGDNQEAFVPQMVNLQVIGGVSFTKGCYTGQEVVARMEYLGKLKKRMYRSHVRSDQPPQPGQDLYLAGSENTQSVGRVVNVAPAPQGGFEMLTVLRIADHDSGADIRLGSPDDDAITTGDLPYSVPVSEK